MEFSMVSANVLHTFPGMRGTDQANVNSCFHRLLMCQRFEVCKGWVLSLPPHHGFWLIAVRL